QKSIREQIAVEISNVLTQLNEATGGEVSPPAIERHHKRMLSVTAEVRSQRILVSVLSLPSDKTRITCYVGADGEGSELEFEENAIREEINEWVGGQIVEALERESD